MNTTQKIILQPSFSPKVVEVIKIPVPAKNIGDTVILINKKNLKKVKAGKPLVVHLDNNIPY
jgi:hypothetical protein